MPHQSGLDRIAIYALGIAVSYGALAQGAFYRDQFMTVAVACVIAALVQALRRQTPDNTGLRIAVVASLALAGWGIITAVGAGDANLASPMVALAMCIAVTIVVAGTLPENARETLTTVVLGIGVVVAISCWIGVAYHHEPYALPSQRVWRSASTITYANAAAAFLIVPMFLALQRIARSERAPVDRVVLWILTTGWVSTLSRGAALAALAGGALFIVLAPRRRNIVRAWPVLPAVALAFGGLVPSLSEGEPARPLLAILGVVVGAVALVAASSGRVASARRPMHAFGVLAAVLVAGALVATGAGVLQDAANRVVATRLQAQSSDRSDLTRVTWEQFRDNPVFGVGPGNIDFNYVNHAGELVHAEFTHNEYLQIAAETGPLGAFCALTVLGGLLLAVRPRAGIRTWESAAGVAIVVVFAVHSALDFLWHIPVLSLMVALSASTLAPRGDEQEGVRSSV